MLGRHERMTRYSLIHILDSVQKQYSAIAQFDAICVGGVTQFLPDIIQVLAPLDTPSQIVHSRERNQPFHLAVGGTLYYLYKLSMYLT